MGNDDDSEDMRSEFKRAQEEVKNLGGWAAFKSGEWLLPIIGKSFRNYYERATDDYFRKKYPGRDTAFIAKKLTSLACRNAVIVGGLTGAAVTTDEIVAIVTAGELVVGLPANIAIAGLAICAESLLLLNIQMQLVAQLARVYGAPLDPDDPEDILTILAFAFGGSVAEAAGKAGMKIGGNAAGKVVKKVVSKEVLKQLQAMGAKIGMKILQRQLIKYTVPVASVGIGAGWNYVTTRSIGKLTRKHIEGRIAERDVPPQVP
jgi:uncharacterized protein (DUF697 family)